MKNYDPDDKNQHFLVSNVFGWGADENLGEAIKKAKKAAEIPLRERTTMVVFYVPLSIDTEYEIMFYVPQVEGITKIFEGKL